MLGKEEQNKKIGIVLKILINSAMFLGFALATQAFFRMEKVNLSEPIVIDITLGLFAMLGLSVLFFVHIMDATPEDVSSRLFSGLIIAVYLGAVFEDISWVVDYYAQNIMIRYLLDAGGFLVTPIALVLFWYYQNWIFGGKSETSVKIKMVVQIFAVFDIKFIIIGSLTGFIFYIDANGNYFEREGVIFASIYPTIVFLLCIIRNLKNGGSLKKRFSILSVGIIPLLMLISTIILPEYHFVYAMFFMNLILIYGTVQSQKGVELAENKKELTEQQTQMMISQIQPHFLYNTLTAIYQLCDIDTELAQKTILDFSIYLRENMEGMMSTTPIQFEKELAHTKTYLTIESLRFSDILRIEYDIKVTDFSIPALTLQPLVENAVKYGIRSREDGGTVTIATKREHSRIYICIHDDGMGFNSGEEINDGKSHTGIDNVRKRLKLMMNADLIIDSELGVGTTATIILEDKNEFIIG